MRNYLQRKMSFLKINRLSFMDSVALTARKPNVMCSEFCRRYYAIHFKQSASRDTSPQTAITGHRGLPAISELKLAYCADLAMKSVTQCGSARKASRIVGRESIWIEPISGRLVMIMLSNQ